MKRRSAQMARMTKIVSSPRMETAPMPAYSTDTTQPGTPRLMSHSRMGKPSDSQKSCFA